MATIRTVTVAGVTGAIGPSLCQALSGAGFEVQALTRKSISNSAKPNVGGVKVIEVDYGSQQELLAALRGQDAVISTLGDTAGAVTAQKALIEASTTNSVKRFIPSEFGSDTMNTRVRSFPFFADKLKHQDMLQRAASEHPSFSYSILITGPFLDWGLSVVPFIINVGSRSAQVFDGGDVPFSTTRVSTLADAVVAILQKPETTKNRTLYVHDGIVTQNQLIARSKDLNGNLPFSNTDVDCDILEKEAWNAFNDPEADPLSWIFSFINMSIWCGEKLCVFHQTDNKLLGLPELNATELANAVDVEILSAMKVFANFNVISGGADCVDSKIAAEKAFEDGKAKLLGYCQSN